MIYCLEHRRRRRTSLFVRSIVVDEMTMQKQALLSNYRHLDLLITYDGAREKSAPCYWVGHK